MVFIALAIERWFAESLWRKIKMTQYQSTVPSMALCFEPFLMSFRRDLLPKGKTTPDKRFGCGKRKESNSPKGEAKCARVKTVEQS